MLIEELISKLSERGFHATPAQITERLGDVSSLGDEDLPGIVEIWLSSEPKDKRSKKPILRSRDKLVKASSPEMTEMELPGKSAVPRSVPVPGSRIDRKAFEESIAEQIAQPLVDANAQIDALEAGVLAAAEHLHQRRQDILDSFFERVAAPVETQSLRHFFSQIPEDLREFFP